jgi:inosine-uridine nucleoside N-ribohydrolase
MVSINYTTHLSEPRSCEKSALHVDCINYSPVPSPTSPSSTHSTQASVEVEVEAGVGASTQYTACRDVDRSVSGVEFLIAACKAHPGEVSILILSPATTLATAVSAFPSLPNYVKR